VVVEVVELVDGLGQAILIQEAAVEVEDMGISAF
jgi:hypothetical protein